MKLHHHIYRKCHHLAAAVGLIPEVPNVGTFALNSEEIKRARSKASGDIHKAFFQSGDRPVHKWYHYLDIYERYFSAYRNRAFFFLEIGVFDGGSLDLWRRYFGASATIVGIDINPQCSQRVDHPNIVRIGSQADPQFLRSVVAEFGPPDIVLDDGSHVATHQRISFDTLFPILKEDGLYVIEDTHTSYWPDWEGGYRRNGSAIEYIKRMIDDMHAWYHNYPIISSARDSINAIHVHDSVVLIEKKQKSKPGFLRSGGDHPTSS